MIVILFGPPACGKGTQAKALVSSLGFKHIAMGDLVRSIIQSGSELGRQIKDIVDKGQLVGDEIICEVIKKTLQELKNEDLVLDGFPRTVKQAIDLDHALALQQQKVSLVIDLVIEPSELVARVAGRSVCVTCGAVYHDAVKRPKQEGICDSCGGSELRRRADDTEEVLRARLKAYEQDTSPVREFYVHQEKLKQVDAAQPIEVVQHQIEAMVRDYSKTSIVKEN